MILVSRAYISERQMRKGDDLSLEQFDRVMEYPRRKVPDIYFRFFSELELLDLGVLGYAVLSCSTLKQGLSMLSRYVELTTDRYTEFHLVENGVNVIRAVPTWRHLGQDESIAADCLGGTGRRLESCWVQT